MAVDFVDVARFLATAGGLADFIVASAVLGYQTPATAGVIDGAVYRYRAESGDLTQWEGGYGVYTAGSTTLARTTIIASSNGGAKVNFSAAPNVGLTIQASDLKGFGPSPVACGRLTLTTGVPVMNSSVLGTTILYYTPYNGFIVMIYNGAIFVPYTFAELSQATTDTTKSPAAVGTFGSAVNVPAVYDIFAWNDAGTLRATRGPAWINQLTGVTTVVVPNSGSTVNWTAHGLVEGMAVVFTTTGALPTGLSANTVYYVARSPAANSFSVSTSVANAAAGTVVSWTTGGSGNTTVSNYQSVRGTGAGTTELQRITGIQTNKNAITNGPGANLGTYVGTVASDAASKLNWNIGSPSAGGSEAQLHVWNMYNRVRVAAVSSDSTGSWSYNSTTWRPANASVGNRISCVRGQDEDTVDMLYQCVLSGGASGDIMISIGLDITNAQSAQITPYFSIGSFTGVATAEYSGNPGLGFHYFQAIERQVTTASAALLVGVVSSTQVQGLRFSGLM